MFYDTFEAKCCWISTMKIRQNATGFSPWKFGNAPKHTWEALIETTPFLNPNLKAQFT